MAYRRPFASKAVFGAILKDFELPCTVPNNIIMNSKHRTQNPSKSPRKQLLRQKDDDIPQVTG